MKIPLLLLLCFISKAVFSQTILEGSLKNQINEPVTNASVIISDLKTGNIIAYNISDFKGFYKISFTFPSEEIQIIVRSMGYEQQGVIINNKSQNKNFILKEQKFELNEIVVKSLPISRKGDTINYMVSSFSNIEDRSISDVLKRMPGIEILDDGTILYQGTSINKYYIEGLDLMEGKYNLVNNNLPHYEVVKVQILENHQPIKILDSIEFSNKAALNITLKNKTTITGQLKAGSGIPPYLWDVNLTPMLFSNKKQMLVSYQSNNTGHDMAQQVNNLTPDSSLEGIGAGSEKHDWLNILQIAHPGFSKRFWLDNNVHILSGNFLQKLKKDYELRINVSYLNDTQQQEGSTETYFFTPNDTISLFEIQYNKLYYNSLETNLTLQRNTEKNYLKNSLQFRGNWDSQRGIILTNDAPLTQNFSKRYFNISNRLQNIFAVRNQLINLNSYVSWNTDPQTLHVNPGQFQSILNNGNPYSEVIQNIDLNTFLTNNSIGFSKGIGFFTISPNAGMILESQNLKTNLSTSEIGDLNDYFFNDLNWNRNKTYINVSTQYKRQKWRIELGTPLNFHFYQIEDSPLQEKQSFNRFTFEPNLSINFGLNTYWKIGGSAGLTNSFGSINQIHYAYILKNYRNIQRINSPLPEIFSKNISGSFSYRNPIQSLFANLSYSYNQGRNNLLYENKLRPDGEVEINAIEEDNQRKSHHLSGRVSKYFNELNTSISINTVLSVQDFQLLLNERLTNIQNNNKRFGVKIDTDITSWLSSEINSTILFSHNRIQKNPTRRTRQQKHHLKLNLHLTKNQYIGFNTEYVNNDLFLNKGENIFSDLLYRYKLSNKNIDLEFHWTNIFNIKNFRSIAINDYSYIETYYRLRPSQLLVMVQFSL